ncbi:ATP-binding cassette domain-containing protein [Nocardia cyriacigeorgica]|uniref:ATP-binding cassette domain-containing protein n=1 Tax=Nocardia cyriacigeorgica TaxID=135487 RepID=A0A6P1DAJ7_9NOCA|nr:ATP-binding cassette domain-containing protein [Nocardia cyriacigeorgica]NEW38828.1 ATP-binding cassette domain-containing protein [Nocardia cyriacigeorgica]NEW46571.1 ATP-binding cassette domain-containing protein [Nocardia cyriacigeorgica]NEW53593.1 ATP-binding cassette domain-containing protein [Nocardia cyriacigeorgica]
MARRPPIDPRLWRYARSARRYLALSVGLSVLTTIAIVVAAVMIGRVLAGVITDPGAREISAWSVELIVLGLAVGCRVAAIWAQARVAHRAGASVVAELEQSVLEAGAQLPPRELESRRTELAVIVGTGLSGLRGYLVGYLPALILAVLVPPVVLVAIAVHDLTSGIIVVITLPLIPIFMILIGLLTEGRARATLDATTRLSDQLLDLFAGMPTLRALGRETGADGSSRVAATAATRPSAHGGDSSATAAGTTADPGSADRPSNPRTMAGRVQELGDALRHRTMSALRIAFLSSMVLEMLATLSVALIAVSIGLRLVFGEMSLYAGVVALVLAPEVYLPLRTVGERFHAAQDGMAAADKAFAVLDPPKAVATGAHSGGVEATGGRIELHDLAVRARDGMAPDGLSAVLRPGAISVLTGPNGCGKSTVLQAVLGLIAPDRGMVVVDGITVSELDSARWWSRVAWLPQRPVLVPGTLRENLELLGARITEPAPTAQSAPGLHELEAACAATGFDAVLDELPDRWDTRVGAGGAGLSLGQRQRMALTRVLAADRPILLLDEPTAHLDAESEATVLAALTARARAGATVVIVAHRAPLLAIADTVIEVPASTHAAEVLS